MRSELRLSYLETNGVSLHVAQAGPPDGKPVVLLHGFPEFWYGWRHQIDQLAEAGFLVIAPDQRGYNRSDRPAGVGSYDLDLLAKDIIGLADRLGHWRFHIVGHDWGATVGWWLASHYPERVERFVALSAPHPSVWRQAMRTILEQRRRSRYVQVLRIPWLPELLMRRRNFKVLVDALRETMRPGAVSEADLDLYRAAWSARGALTGMVNWYRALMLRADRALDAAPVQVRTLVIWGDRDRFGVPALAERSAALCSAAELVRLDASHWTQHDEPERVNALLLEFLGQ
jgi:pimeloyl-ACP methyl ester carboxylesterase